MAEPVTPAPNSTAGQAPATEEGTDLETRMLNTWRRMLGKEGGSSSKAAIRLIRDNYRDREKVRSLERQIAELEKLVPKEGAIVVSGEDAKTLKEIQALNLPWATIKSNLTEYPALKQKAGSIDAEASSKEIARAFGWNVDAASAITDLIGNRQLHVEQKDVTYAVHENGRPVTKTKRVPHVRPLANDKAELVPLNQYIEQSASYLKPALMARPDGARSADPTSVQISGNQITGNPGSIAWVDQGPDAPASRGGSEGDSDVFAQRRKAAASAPDPFSILRTPAQPAQHVNQPADQQFR